MLTNKDILADMHTHTHFSKHAYSTVKENIEAAKKRGLKYIAITDHYYGNGDDLDKKNEINRIQYLGQRVNRVESDITVIGSAEFNLGQDVYTPEKLEGLLCHPVGLHSWFVDRDSLTLDDVYNLFVEAHELKGYNAFNHIEREFHKLNHGQYIDAELFHCLDRIVNYAYKNDIWLEVNESTIIENDGEAANRLFVWLQSAKNNGNKIYLGSDAHYCEEVGKFDRVIRLLNIIDYPKELILNCNEDMLKSMFDK